MIYISYYEKGNNEEKRNYFVNTNEAFRIFNNSTKLENILSMQIMRDQEVLKRWENNN